MRPTVSELVFETGQLRNRLLFHEFIFALICYDYKDAVAVLYVFQCRPDAATEEVVNADNCRFV